MRLTEALTTLDRSEHREFSKFVHSPFFNQKPQPIALLAYLQACLDEKTTPQQEIAYAHIYEGETYNDQKMRLVNSNLLALLEHFWVYQEKFKDIESTKISLVATYRKRNLPKHFQATFREANLALEQQSMRNAEFFQLQNQLSWEQYRFESGGKRGGSFNLQEISDGMDVAFIAQKLRLACLALAHQAVSQADYQIGLISPILEAVAIEKLAEIPAIALYHHCYCFLKGVDAEVHFSLFKQKLLINAALFPDEERRGLYLLAINFGIKKINEMAKPYFRETLDLYQNALSSGLLLENGQLSRFAFNNITAIAIQSGDIAWAETFVLENKNYLERNYRESTVSLNLARIAYASKDHKAVLENLQRADYKDLISTMSAKILQLKVYYETSEYDLLDSHLGSIKNFIRRQTGIGYHRSNYSNIVKYTERLLAINITDRAAISSLIQKIENEPILTERTWFLEQINEILPP
jgi:hypothetical protein